MFTILAAYLLLFEDCFHKTTAGDNQLQMVRQTMQHIFAASLHNNLWYFVLYRPTGTGKTRVIQALQKFADLLNLSNTILVTATTGAAAIILGAQTYHSALQLNCSVKSKIVSSQLRACSLSIRILIIDEMFYAGSHRAKQT